MVISHIGVTVMRLVATHGHGPNVIRRKFARVLEVASRAAQVLVSIRRLENLTRERRHRDTQNVTYI